jgi:Transposase
MTRPGVRGGAVRKSRFSEEQIIAVPKESEAGVETGELCRRHGITRACYYRWKSKFGGMEVSEAAYQDFLTLWKDADPDIPIPKQAKAEYAKLQ